MSVRWVGAQRDVLGGDVEGKVDLKQIETEIGQREAAEIDPRLAHAHVQR